MKLFFLNIALVLSSICFSQNEQLAEYYFEKGDFEKAQINFEQLVKENPRNTHYFQRTIECYQQLKLFHVAEKSIQERLEKYNQNTLLIELGYNFKLQKNEEKAKTYFEKALEKIKQNPNEAYSIASYFERKVLLEYALNSYKIASEVNPNLNFRYQMALIYGQLGNIEMMTTTLLDEAYSSPNNSILIKNQLLRYMNEKDDDSFIEFLKKSLLIRSQKTQDIFWNEYLSWFYLQQKELDKAFLQEKAIYKRNQESLSNILNLAEIAIDEKNNELAQTILTFILENTKNVDLIVQVNSFLMRIKIEKASENEYQGILDELNSLLNTYGINTSTLPLQLITAHFISFKLNQPDQGKIILKRAMDLNLNTYELAQIKMELASIFLYEEKFNQALLYYSQVEQDLKNDSLGHEASLKVAKTSYFKGDFQWALKQFKELKSATTQLIANDALEYFLLINDNTAADSTQTALKQFARGDYLLYQNKNQEAIEQFESILKSFKGQEIIPITLLRLGKIYEAQSNFILALDHYKTIIDFHNDGIYTDEALYFSAEIYTTNLLDPEKAKPLYEKIIFNHQDSIYFVESRNKYRKIRGDLAP